MNKKVRNLCREAEMIAIGAERAATAGDMVAFCHLSVAAQERVMLAKQMNLIEMISVEEPLPGKGSGF